MRLALPFHHFLFPLSLFLLSACSGGFFGKGKDPTGQGDGSSADGDADTDADSDTDTDTDGDADADSDADSDADTDADSDADSDADTDADPDPDAVDDDGDGQTEEEGDCDDTDDSVSTEAIEVAYDGIDNDCDPTTPDDDVDGDGYLLADDCNDKDPLVHPDADEDTADGKDNDCDGLTDERFETETVDASVDAGSPSAIDTDSGDRVQLAWFDLDHGLVRYAIRSTGGAWSTPIDALTEPGAVLGEWMDAVVDAADRFQIAYTREDSSGLRELDYAYREATGTWSSALPVEDYASSASLDVGQYVSIAVDSSNLPSFTWYDADYGIPMLADTLTSPWAFFGIDALYTQVDINYAGATGTYTSLAIDSAGYDHIAYYDGGAFADEAQYAYPGDLSFSNTVGAKGKYTSLALQSDDTPCVALFRTDTADLQYGCSTDGGLSWSLSTLDSTGSVGSYARLAFDSADLPWIAYYDETNKNLKVAHHDGSAWALLTVDSTGDVGLSPDIAIDGNDLVYVSYYDRTNGALKLAVGH